MASARVVEPGEPVPKGGGVYRVGNALCGRRPHLRPARKTRTYSAVGLASWYGDDFHGRYTANGEIFDMNSITAAHPTLPLPCYVRVTDLENHRSIIVRVNDRGPYVGNRVIDLSVRTAKLLGFYGKGVAKVKVEYVGRAPLAGSDDRKLEATLREGVPAPACGSPPPSRSCRRCSTRGRSSRCRTGPVAARPALSVGRGRARDVPAVEQQPPHARGCLPPRRVRSRPQRRQADGLAGFRLCPGAL